MSKYSFDPHLFDELEQERLEAMRWRKNVWLVGVPIVAVVSVISAVTFGPEGLITLLIGGGLTYMIAEFKLFELKERMKTDILSHMAEARGWSFDVDGPSENAVKIYRDLGLLRSHNELEVEDLFEGELDGVRFELFEALAKMRTKNRKSDSVRTVFSGLLARFNFPKDFQGSTVVLTDSGFFNWAAGFAQKGERVTLEDPVFEKQFQVYSSDQVEARYLLTPSFMQRLLDIRNVFPGAEIQAAFERNSLYLAIDAKSSNRDELGFFDVKDLSQPLSQQSAVLLFERELQMFEEIVDGLNLDASTRI
ncbi:DUF3137 domain-containing protein [Parvibaculaceae bacterium PLY_AMNH_Bact1]|nr:DUF3137 domain-containing protein [Parvibaculaceae bacterium PLY_AMNH_Bact1]